MAEKDANGSNGRNVRDGPRSNASSWKQKELGDYYQKWESFEKVLEAELEKSNEEEARKDREKLSGNLTEPQGEHMTANPGWSEKAVSEAAEMSRPEKEWKARREREKGNEHFKAREYSAAVEAYTLALKLNPNDVTAHNNRAAAYLKLKHWDDAELDCTHALKLEASNWKAHMRRASARLEKGGEEHVRAARDDAAQALEINPNEKEIEKLKGKCDRTIEEIESNKSMKRVTIQEVEEESEDEENEVQERFGRGMSDFAAENGEADRHVPVQEWHEGHISPEADECNEGGIENVKPHGQGLKDVQRAGVSEGNGEKIVREEKSSESAGRKSSHTEAAGRTGAETAHEMDSTAGVAEQGDDWLNIKAQGNNQFHAGDLKSARDSYSRALQKVREGSSEAAALLCNRSAVNEKLGRWEDAEADATAAIGGAPLKGHYRRAVARRDMGDAEGALNDIRQVLDQRPQDSQALSLARELSGKKSERQAKKKAEGSFSARKPSAAGSTVKSRDAVDPGREDDRHRAGRSNPESRHDSKRPAAFHRQHSDYIPMRSGRMEIEEVEDKSSPPGDSGSHRETHGPRSAAQRTTGEAAAAGHGEARSNRSGQNERKGGTGEAEKDRGNAAFKEGRLLEAESAFTDCIERKNAEAGVKEAALNNRALVRMKLENYEGMLNDANNALALNGQNAKAQYRRGAALRLLGRLHEAEVSLERACALAPSSVEARSELSRCRKDAKASSAGEAKQSLYSGAGSERERARTSVSGEANSGTSSSGSSSRFQATSTDTRSTKIPIQEAEEEDDGARPEGELKSMDASHRDKKGSSLNEQRIAEGKRGARLLREKRPAQSLEAYNKAIDASDGPDAHLLASRAQAHLELSEWEHAQADAERALSQNPSEERAKSVLQTAKGISLGDEAAKKVEPKLQRKPQTEVEFEQGAEKAAASATELAEYVKLLEERDFPVVFKSSLGRSHLAYLTRAVDEGMRPFDDAVSAEIVIRGLTRTPRFKLVPFMLSREDRKRLERAFDWVSACESLPQERRDHLSSLRASFRV